jgi:ADP-ribosyl-[dinitrogen reductase] hydrolase
MVSFMTSPRSHNDTYIEEYLRHFFNAHADNKELTDCGRGDEKHIGGYSLMLPLTIAFSEQTDFAMRVSLEHLALTHGGPLMNTWGAIIVSTLLNVLKGNSMKDSIKAAAQESKIDIDIALFEKLTEYPDTTVVTKHFSSACYVDYAVPATIFLALKYEKLPEEGIIANTMCGGDNAGRGAVLGALLGAVNGMEGWPAEWVDGLLQPPPDIQQI